MSEEPITDFPPANDPEHIWQYIKSELESAGIEVQRIGIDDPATIDHVVVTTDREVPETIKSDITEYCADKGIAVEFRVSAQDD